MTQMIWVPECKRMTEAHSGGVDDRGSYCLQFRLDCGRTSELASIVTKSGMTQWVRCSPKSIPKIPSRMLVSLEEATSASNTARQIKPARLRCDVLLQRPAIARLASFALVQLALLPFAPSLRAIPLEQPVDASSLPDAPEPQSGTSSPALQPGPGREDTQAGDPSIVSPATDPCTTCRLNWYQRFTNGPQERPLTPRRQGLVSRAQLPRPVQPRRCHR
jgi:hypothetical protein